MRSLSLFPLLVLLACGGSAAAPSPAVDGGADVASDAPEAPPQTTITSTGSLKEARANHTATLLDDGRVLVVGGEQVATRTPTASIEVWDPNSGQWTTLAPLPSAVVGHTATRLADGRVLIAGSGKYTASGSPSGEDVSDAAYLFDPKTSLATPTGSMKHKRSHHFAIALANGKVLVGGGADAVPGEMAPALQSTELYDPATGQFTEDAALTDAREMAQAVALDDDHVLVVSGVNTKKGMLASSEIYDVKAHAFSEAGNLVDGGRMYHSVLRTKAGTVFVLGGVQSAQTGVVFLDSVETWNGKDFALGPLLPKGRNSAPLEDLGGHVVAFGGYAWDGLSTYFDDVLWLGRDGWQLVGHLKFGTFGHTTTKLADGRVLVVGGSNAKTQSRAELVSFK